MTPGLMMELMFESKEGILFTIWWAGYAVALVFYYHKDMLPTVFNIAVAVLKAMLWPITLPVSALVRFLKWFKKWKRKFGSSPSN